MAKRRHMYIAMDITNRCNLRCAMCMRSVAPQDARQDMTVDQFRAIGDHCFDRATVLALSCAAEPLMAKHLFEILQVLPDYGIPSTEMVTNGILLDERRIKALIDAHLSRLIVSIDGTTAATYESIRNGARFDRLIDNLHVLRRIKRAQKVSYPVLRFNFVMMRRNIDELPDLIKLAAKLGASQVTAQHVAIYEGSIPEDESLFRHRERTNVRLLEAHRLAARLGIILNAPPLFASDKTKLADRRWLLYSRLRTGIGVIREFGRQRTLTLLTNLIQRKLTRRNRFCHHPWEVMFIDTNGNVRPCVNWNNEPPVGNCLTGSFDDLWHGPGYAQLRQELTGTRPLRQNCLHCPALASGKVDDPSSFEQIPL
jgi:radical SAM protein with 4Fe4S-binding SPASM domain